MDIGVFQIIGALGLLFITYGVALRKRRSQDKAFVLGGICLLAYSISIRDPIFIVLQIIFTTVSAYELIK